MYDRNYPIQREIVFIILGSVLIIVAGFLNVYNQFFQSWFFYWEYTGYILFLLVALALIFIAIGIKNITEIYFIDHITKTGKQTAIWFYIYSGLVLLNMAVFGWPGVSGFVGLPIILGRIMGFWKMNKTLEKIKRIFDLRVGSPFYPIFGFYSVIIAFLGGVASYADDEVFQIFLFTFNGTIESLLLLIVGLKLIIDFRRINAFILEKDIKPYTRTNHPQKKAMISKLQQKTQLKETITRISELQDDKKEEVSVDTPIEEKMEYITCPLCGELTLALLNTCINCRETISKEKRKIFRREKLIQRLTIAGTFVFFIVYAFLYGNPLIKILAGIVTIVLIILVSLRYFLNFLADKGSEFANVFNEILYLFLGVPVMFVSATYLPIAFFFSFLKPDKEWVLIVLYVLLTIFEILSIYYLLRKYLRDKKMTFFQYLKYMFDFKKRAEEARLFREKAEQVNTFYDNIYRVKDKAAKRMKERSKGFKEFDWKSR